jgi:hypothetical protein
MTTATARANAARKAAERGRLALLLIKWHDLYTRAPDSPASAYLALGGTEQELHAFAAMLKEKGELKP